MGASTWLRAALCVLALALSGPLGSALPVLAYPSWTHAQHAARARGLASPAAPPLVAAYFPAAGCRAGRGTLFRVAALRNTNGTCTAGGSSGGASMHNYFRVAREPGSSAVNVSLQCNAGCAACGVPATLTQPQACFSGAGSTGAVQLSPSTACVGTGTAGAQPGDVLVSLFNNHTGCWASGATTAITANVGPLGVCTNVTGMGWGMVAKAVNGTDVSYTLSLACSSRSCASCGISLAGLPLGSGTCAAMSPPGAPVATGVSLETVAPASACPVPPPAPPPVWHPHNESGLVWGLCIGTVVGLFCIGLAMWWWCPRRVNYPGGFRGRAAAARAGAVDVCEEVVSAMRDCAGAARGGVVVVLSGIAGACQALARYLWSSVGCTRPWSERQKPLGPYHAALALVCIMSATWGVNVWVSYDPLTAYIDATLVEVGMTRAKLAGSPLLTTFDGLASIGLCLAISQAALPFVTVLLDHVLLLRIKTRRVLAAVALVFGGLGLDFIGWMAMGTLVPLRDCIHIPPAKHGIFSAHELVSAVNEGVQYAFASSTVSFIGQELFFVLQGVTTALLCGTAMAYGWGPDAKWLRRRSSVAVMRCIARQARLVMPLALLLPATIVYQAAQSSKVFLVMYLAGQVVVPWALAWALHSVGGQLMTSPPGGRREAESNRLQLCARLVALLAVLCFGAMCAVTLVVQARHTSLSIAYPALVSVRSFVVVCLLTALLLADGEEEVLMLEEGTHDGYDAGGGVFSNYGAVGLAATASGTKRAPAVLHSPTAVLSPPRAGPGVHYMRMEGDSDDDGAWPFRGVRRSWQGDSGCRYRLRQLCCHAKWCGRDGVLAQALCGARRWVTHSVVWQVLFETKERAAGAQQEHGSRPPGRRFCLVMGTVLFGFLEVHEWEYLSTTSGVQQAEGAIRDLGMHLTWPKNGTQLDAPLHAFHIAEGVQLGFYALAFAVMALALLVEVPWCACFKHRMCGRWTNELPRASALRHNASTFLTSFLLPLLGLGCAVPAFPNYISLTNVSSLCPDCGRTFTAMVRSVAGQVIGLGFVGDFTVSILALLLAATPSLLRSVLVKLTDELKHGGDDGKAAGAERLSGSGTKTSAVGLQGLRGLYAAALLPSAVLSGFPLIFIVQLVGVTPINTCLIVAIFVAPLLVAQAIWLARTLVQATAVYFATQGAYIGLMLTFFVRVLVQAGQAGRILTLLASPWTWVQGIAELCLGLVVLCDILYRCLEVQTAPTYAPQAQSYVAATDVGYGAFGGSASGDSTSPDTNGSRGSGNDRGADTWVTAATRQSGSRRRHRSADDDVDTTDRMADPVACYARL